MSNPPPPSAFDVLMSGARAASAKNKQSSSSSPNNSRKRKISPHSAKPSQNPSETETVQKPNEAREETAEPEPPNKIIIRKAASSMIDKLKERVPRLKRKPSEFDPGTVACWEKGKSVPFLFLSLAFHMISEESSRIVITDILCNLLRTVMHATPEDLVPVVYLSACRIAPPHEGLELGIQEATIIKVAAEACGRTESHIKNELKDRGDLGLVVQASRSSQSLMRKPDALTIRKVFNTFHLIAKESGKNSQKKRENHIKSLLVAATDCEPLYLIRLLMKVLRIGCAEQTLLGALGQAAVYNEEHSKPPPEIQSPLEEAAKIVKQVYCVLPDYGKIVSALLKDGVWVLPKTCIFTPGVPVGPMLAKATTSVTKVLNKFQDVEFTCEYKYDGERAQIHYMENGSVEIYSRNSERNTGKFPDVVAAVSRCSNRNRLNEC